ncbi:hypothetical protein CKCBHOJB_01720 [Thauera sp. GDN1]|nr:hypothetical protein CKCBHOJB_01720 [Thauera sp. GDN1]
MPELLAWLDQCDLRFVSPEGEEDVLGVTDQERIERLQSAINALELTRGELRTAANINREFILALIEIARVGLDALFEKHLTQPDNSHDDDTTARSLDE